MSTTTWTVTGMTCEHCVASVTEEVGEVAGVDSLEVELASGLLTVHGGPEDAAVVAAVQEAGYAVAGAPVRG